LRCGTFPQVEKTGRGEQDQPALAIAPTTYGEWHWALGSAAQRMHGHADLVLTCENTSDTGTSLVYLGVPVCAGQRAVRRARRLLIAAVRREDTGTYHSWIHGYSITFITGCSRCGYYRLPMRLSPVVHGIEPEKLWTSTQRRPAGKILPGGTTT
jgi:hypothetical protein